MNQFEHLRHKQGSALSRPRELIVACAPMRSNVNISSLARTASACAVERLVLTGNASLISKIARDGAEELEVSIHRSLAPVLQKLRSDGYRLVGLEQTTNSTSIPPTQRAYIAITFRGVLFWWLVMSVPG